MIHNRSDMRALLKAGVEFHGHLGPYLVLGLHMGRVAVRMLKPKRIHELSVKVWTRKSPPQSCILDGIQVSSGCTLGKGTITVEESTRTKAGFRKGNRIVVIRPGEAAIRLLTEVSKDSHPLKIREIAIALHQIPDHELLTIK